MNLDIFSLLRKPELPELFWEESETSKAWSLDQVLFHIETSSGKEPIFIKDILRGVQIFGSIGSGKTSGSGRQIAEACLRAGFGGLVFCVKNDEAELWCEYAKRTDREKDLIIIDECCNYRFNFLDEEIKRDKSSLQLLNITKLILDVHALYSREDSKKGQDPFWEQQLQTCLTHAIVITAKRNTSLTIRGLIKTLRDAVDCADFINQESRLVTHPFEEECERLLKGSRLDQQLKDAVDFYLGEFRSLPEKTRSIVVAMFRTLAEPLMQEPLEKLLCSDTNIKPDDCFDGKIIVVNLPIHTYRHVGLLAQLIWKMVFINAVKRRIDPKRPVFMWADESQFFAEENDIQFLTTSRSQKCATIYATQNIPNYESKIGNNSSVNAILGSLNLKIFHQNNDPKTNGWASDSIGKVSVKKTSVSQENSDAGPFAGSGKKSTSTSETLEHDVQARLFTNLKEGGSSNEFLVEGVVHMSGRKFKNGKTWAKAKFSQK